jgi:hypothetical protein
MQRHEGELIISLLRPPALHRSVKLGVLPSIDRGSRPSSTLRNFGIVGSPSSRRARFCGTSSDIGKPAGVLDANDDLSVGPVLLITDPAQSLRNPDNPTHTAGTTFMGQFMDHDMSFDVGSRLGVPTPPETATNGRTPAFDLNSVYGGGPVVSPQLYEPTDHARFRVESGGLFEDPPRTPTAPPSSATRATTRT